MTIYGIFRELWQALSGGTYLFFRMHLSIWREFRSFLRTGRSGLDRPCRWAGGKDLQLLLGRPPAVPLPPTTLDRSKRIPLCTDSLSLTRNYGFGLVLQPSP